MCVDFRDLYGTMAEKCLDMPEVYIRVEQIARFKDGTLVESCIFYYQMKSILVTDEDDFFLVPFYR